MKLSRTAPFFYAFTPLLGWLIYVAFAKPFTSVTFDDDFATIWEVKHYLETGEYVRHQFTAPFTFPQTMMGVAFVKLLPFMEAEKALRLSTLAFSLFGLYALYGLAKQRRLSDKTASILSLSLMASFIYSYTSSLFYSDVPFLACSLVAIALYTRGTREQSMPSILIGSLFCGLAVLFRQTGIALVAAACIHFCLNGEHRNPKTLLAALAIPILCTIYMLCAQIDVSTYAMVLHERAQSRYMTDAGLVARNSLFRTVLAPTLMTVFATPLVFIYATSISWRAVRRVCAGEILGPSAYACLSGALMLACAPALWHFAATHTFRLPYIPWYFEYSIFSKLDWRGVYSSIVMMMTAPLWLAALRSLTSTKNALPQRDSFNIRIANWSRSLPLLESFTILNLAILLLIFQVGDKYYLFMLPIFLLTVGTQIDSILDKRYATIAMALMFVIIGNAVILRYVIFRLESENEMVLLLQEMGIPKDLIYHSRTPYDEFQRYVSEVGTNPPNLESGIYFDFSHRWTKKRLKEAHYVVEMLKSSELRALKSSPLRVRRVTFLGMLPRYVVATTAP